MDTGSTNSTIVLPLASAPSSGIPRMTPARWRGSMGPKFEDHGEAPGQHVSTMEDERRGDPSHITIVLALLVALTACAPATHPRRRHPRRRLGSNGPCECRLASPRFMVKSFTDAGQRADDASTCARRWRRIRATRSGPACASRTSPIDDTSSSPSSIVAVRGAARRRRHHRCVTRCGRTARVRPPGANASARRRARVGRSPEVSRGGHTALSDARVFSV